MKAGTTNCFEKFAGENGRVCFKKFAGDNGRVVGVNDEHRTLYRALYKTAESLATSRTNNPLVDIDL